jgi:response regulator RpfG family c-di-GMP phosphodiesterase
MADLIRLLYAEDNALDADLTRTHFAAAAPDIDLEIVSTGEACLLAAAQGSFDALLLDYRLADMDGLEVLRRLARAGLGLPVAMVTGSGDEELVVQALRIGARDYIPKTGDYLEALPDVVRGLVSDQRQQRTSPTITPGLRRVLFVEHEAMDIDLTLTHFAETAPHLKLEVVQSGREALRRLTGEEHFDLVLTDLRMPDMSGLEMLRAARHRGVRLPFIVITGKGDEDTATATLKLGAYDYIVKRDDYLTHLTFAVDHAIIRHQLDVANSHLRADLVALNSTLEQKVIARTAELETEVAERTQREHELAALVTVAAALRSATRANMAPVILDQLEALLKADGLTLEMLDPGGGYNLELGRGIWSQLTNKHLPPGVGLSALVAADGQPYLNNNARADSRLLQPELLGECNAMLAAPLIARNQTIGVLWVARRDEFTLADQRLLMAIGDIAANAIHRAALYEQMERQIQHLAALRTIDQAISASVDLRVTLAIVLEQVLAQLRVDAAGVLLLNPHGLSLEWVAERGFRGTGLQRLSLRLGEGHAGRAAIDRRVVSVADLRTTSGDPARGELFKQEGFTTYHAVPLITKGQVKGVLEVFHRAPPRLDADWLELLETLAGQTAIAVDNAALFERLQQSSMELVVAYDATIEGWAAALDLRDKETEGHSRRVTDLTVRLARQMGVSEKDIIDVRRGALLHDIGKMGVPDTVLFKPGALNDDEWVLMRKHPEYAYRMLAPIAYLRGALDIPYCHHEKWDGSGYPRGLKGDEIPLAARLFAVVDVWDALRSDRPYRPAWPEAKVRENLLELKGTHFDPRVVDLFLREIDREPLPE